MIQEEEQALARPDRRWLHVLVSILGLLLLLSFFALRRLQAPDPEQSTPVADVASQRLLTLGSVVGFAAPFDTHAWLGIPFARPPVDARRWRAPQPPEAWADTFDALTFGPPCLQLSSPLAGIPAEDEEGFGGSENCLTLNIWAPRASAETGESLQHPVMVWIHGGGNTYGAASLKMYDGAQLAGTQDVVVVSIQYRLGPLGWFSHPALRALAEDPLEASGNFATLDHIRALEWVQEHISEFGGDPKNVTIFGQSAGGVNVIALLLADAAEGLFHRAIAQSGATDSVSRAQAENSPSDPDPGLPHSSEQIVTSLIEAAGVVPDREAARRYAAALPAGDLVTLLRTLSGREVLNAYRESGEENSLEVPKPIRDGALLPEGEWIERLREGHFHRVPIVLGATRDERKLELSQDREHVRQTFGLIYRIRDRDDYSRRARTQSDLKIVRAVTGPARAMAASGWPEVYAYRFDWDDLPRVLGQDMSELLGAAHGFELPFVFGRFDLGNPLLSQLLYPAEGQAEREDLSARIMSYWAEFARNGRPDRGGRDDLPEWRAWSEGAAREGQVLVLDAERDGGIRLEGPR